MTTQTKLVPLQEILDNYVPGSMPQPWTWEDESRDLDERGCCCRSKMCDQPRHLEPGQYQRELENHLRKLGHIQDSTGIVLGNDGRVWDGHHRIVAARRLGFTHVPVEV